MPLGVLEAEIPQVVVLRNTSSSPYTIRHLRRVWTIPPHGELHAPWDAAQSFLGDPRAIDVGRNKFRRILYDQVRALNNFYLGFDTETEAEAKDATLRTGRPHSSWEAKRPPIEVYSVEGQRIYMLIDDPSGTIPNPWGALNTAVDTSNSDVLRAEVARLSEQMANLTRLLAERQPADLPADLAAESTPLSGDTTPHPPISNSPPTPPHIPVGHIPTMEDGIRTDLLPTRSATLPTPEQLFTDEDSTAVASSIPSPDPSTSSVTKDSPRSTKPVARPRSRN